MPLTTNPDSLTIHRVNKLLKQYKKHGTLIIGVDFDYTIYNPDLNHMHKDIINFLLDAQSINCKLCLWTANSAKIPFILNKCKEVGLIFDYINDSPIKIEEGIRKPHFNILLDDVAGLSQTLEILVNVLAKIKEIKCN